MGKVIAIANQKGGVGKTTSTINLSASMALKGMRILVIDCDPQGNATSGLGIDKRTVENSIYELIIDACEIKECIMPSAVKNLEVIPSSVDLAGAEIELIGNSGKDFILKNKIDEVRDNYDYIFIDCPPALNTLTVNALTTADSVLVPIQCEFYALEGLSQLIYTIDLIKARLNAKLEIDGIVFTMYDGRTNLSLQVVESVKNNLKQNIYNTMIPRNVRLAEAPSYGLPICMYDGRSSGAVAYDRLAEEILIKDGKIKPQTRTKRATEARNNTKLFGRK